MDERIPAAASGDASRRTKRLLSVWYRNEVATLARELRSQGFGVERTQGHADDAWRFVRLAVSDRAGPIASMRFGAKTDGPRTTWGWSLACGDAASDPPPFEPADFGRTGPPVNRIAETFQTYFDACRRAVRPPS